MNFGVTCISYHYYHEGDATLCESSFTVAPPITSIFLNVGCSMRNFKSQYFHHEVVYDQLCGHSFTRINPFTYDFYIYIFSHMKRGSSISNPTSDILLLMDVIFLMICLLLSVSTWFYLSPLKLFSWKPAYFKSSLWYPLFCVSTACPVALYCV